MNIKKPFTNTKTDQPHSAWLTTAVGWITFLLIKFGVVPADFFDAQTLAAIVGLLGLGIMFYRTYFKK